MTPQEAPNTLLDCSTFIPGCSRATYEQTSICISPHVIESSTKIMAHGTRPYQVLLVLDCCCCDGLVLLLWWPKLIHSPWWSSETHSRVPVWMLIANRKAGNYRYTVDENPTRERSSGRYCSLCFFTITVQVFHYYHTYATVTAHSREDTKGNLTTSWHQDDGVNETTYSDKYVCSETMAFY